MFQKILHRKIYGSEGEDGIEEWRKLRCGKPHDRMKEGHGENECTSKRQMTKTCCENHEEMKQVGKPSRRWKDWLHAGLACKEITCELMGWFHVGSATGLVILAISPPEG